MLYTLPSCVSDKRGGVVSIVAEGSNGRNVKLRGLNLLHGVGFARLSPSTAAPHKVILEGLEAL